MGHVCGLQPQTPFHSHSHNSGLCFIVGNLLRFVGLLENMVFPHFLHRTQCVKAKLKFYANSSTRTNPMPICPHCLPFIWLSPGPYLVVESCQHKALQGNYEFVYGSDSSRRRATGPQHSKIHLFRQAGMDSGHGKNSLEIGFNLNSGFVHGTSCVLIISKANRNH